MPNPEKFNDDLRSEIAAKAFCKAAQYGLKLIEEQQSAPVSSFTQYMEVLSSFMAAAGQNIIDADGDDVTSGKYDD